MFVVDMVQLDNTDSCSFLLIVLSNQIGHQGITELDQLALVSESEQVLQTLLIEGLECFVKLLVKFVDKVDKSWQDLEIVALESVNINSFIFSFNW